jgi:ribosomal protein L11 methyltransferase
MDAGTPADTTYLAQLTTNAKTAALISDALAARFDVGEAAVAAFEAVDGRWTVEVHFGHVPDETSIRALVAEIAGGAAADAVCFAHVHARDWVAASLSGLHPVPAGRFVIHGAHDRARIGANHIGIEIEAGLAFGTGHHGTTRGCLLALGQILKARRPRRILDVGTGTGVLAIAAAKALRRPVLAGDIDRDAVTIARENAAANRAGGLVTVVRAAGLWRHVFQRGTFDLVFANILLRPLTAMAKPMARILRPDARVVISGLLPNQANAALAAYGAHGLSLERRIGLDGWMTLVLRKPARVLRTDRPAERGERSAGRHTAAR